MMLLVFVFLIHVNLVTSFVQNIFTQTLQEDRAVHHLTNSPVPYSSVDYDHGSAVNLVNRQPLYMLLPSTTDGTLHQDHQPGYQDQHAGYQDVQTQGHEQLQNTWPAYSQNSQSDSAFPVVQNTHNGVEPNSVFPVNTHQSHLPHSANTHQQHTNVADSHHATFPNDESHLLSIPIQRDPNTIWSALKQQNGYMFSNSDPTVEQDYIDFTVADLSGTEPAAGAQNYLINDSAFKSFVNSARFAAPKFEKLQEFRNWKLPLIEETQSVRNTQNSGQIQIHPPVTQRDQSYTAYDMLGHAVAKLDTAFNMQRNIGNQAIAKPNFHVHSNPVKHAAAHISPPPAAIQGHSGNQPTHPPQLNIVHLYPHSNSQQHPGPPNNHRQPVPAHSVQPIETHKTISEPKPVHSAQMNHQNMEKKKIDLINTLITLLDVPKKQIGSPHVAKSVAPPGGSVNAGIQPVQKQALYVPQKHPIISHHPPARITPVLKTIVPVNDYAQRLYQPLPAPAHHVIPPMNMYDALSILLGGQPNNHYKQLTSPRHGMLNPMVSPITYRALSPKARRRLRGRSPISRYAKIVGEDALRGLRRRRRRGKKKRKLEDDDYEDDNDTFDLEVTEDDDYVVLNAEDDNDEDYEDIENYNDEYYNYKK